MRAAVFMLAVLIQGCWPSDYVTGLSIGTGRVYLCATDGSSVRDHEPGDPETIEVCADESTLALEHDVGELADCMPTPRHVGICRHACPGDAGGANALNGQWCPPKESP